MKSLKIAISVSVIALAAARLVAAPSPEAQAEQILAASGVKGGLVVHVGCGDGRLTAALRANDSYLVQGLDSEAANVKEARAHVRSKEVYGPVSIDRFDGKRLPFADGVVNLIVVSGVGPTPRRSGSGRAGGCRVSGEEIERVPAQLPRRLVAVGDSVYVTLGLGAPVAALDAATGKTIRTYDGTDGTEEILHVDGTLYLVAAGKPTSRPWSTKDKYAGFNDLRPEPETWAWKPTPRRIKAIEARTGRAIWEVTSSVVPMTARICRITVATGPRPRTSTSWRPARASNTSTSKPSTGTATTGCAAPASTAWCRPTALRMHRRIAVPATSSPSSTGSPHWLRGEGRKVFRSKHRIVVW